MKNISKEDYIIWDDELNAPLESLDIVYHYTSVVELINDKFKLGKNEKFVCVAELPLKWQTKIDEAIEKAKTLVTIKSVFNEITSLYDYADDLANNGQDEEGERMRTKLNYISEFFINKFENYLVD